MKWFLTGLASSFNYWKNLRSYFSFSLIILMDYFSIPQNNSITKYLRLVKTQDLLQICLYSFTELSWGRMVCIFVCLFAFLELFSFTSIFILQVACLDYSRFVTRVFIWRVLIVCLRNFLCSWNSIVFLCISIAWSMWLWKK